MEHSSHFGCRSAPYTGETIESTAGVPRIQGTPFMLCERAIAFGKNSIGRHHRNLLSGLRRGQHGWADAKPASKIDGIPEVLVASSEPMKNRDACRWIGSQTLQDF